MTLNSFLCCFVYPPCYVLLFNYLYSLNINIRSFSPRPPPTASHSPKGPRKRSISRELAPVFRLLRCPLSMKEASQFAARAVDGVKSTP